MSRLVPLLLAHLALVSLVACGDKPDEDEEEEDEDDGTVYSGDCPQVDVGSAVGEDIASGSTAGGDDNWGWCGGEPTEGALDSASAGSSSPDVSLAWQAPASGEYTAYTQGSRFDTTLTLIEGSCGGDVLECDDDGGRDLDSAITFDADEGQTYIFVLDGFGNGDDGDWEFSIVEGGNPWRGDSGDWDHGDTGRRSRSLGKSVPSALPEIRTRFGPTGVDIKVSGGAGGWMLGVARTADLADPHAFLADCHTGAFVAGAWQSACQPLRLGTNQLTYGGDPMALASGTTLLRSDDAEGVTWLLESDRSLGGNGRCFVWGHDPAAFASLGCQEL
jgi:hypothetical protein